MPEIFYNLLLMLYTNSMKKISSTLLLSVLCTFSFAQSARNLYGFTKTNNVSVTQNGSLLADPWAGGINSAQVNTIDLDLDGIEDLVIFDRQGKNFIPYLAVGSGASKHYEYAPEYEKLLPPVAFISSWALFRDYNCDGKKDIFFSHGSYFYVWENTSGSSLSFAPANGGQFIKSVYSGNSSNLYVNAANIPGIDDINGDGAIDLLTYVNGGIEVEYHQGQTPCGLDFINTETCWGHFTETGFKRGVDLNACTPRRKKTLHDGSTILPIDLNNDQVKDLILGNITFKTMTAVYNGGNKDSAHMISQDTTYPTQNPIEIPFFPGAYYEDVDFDGKPDLMVSPALATSDGINKKSLYFYKNTGTIGTPAFTLQSEDFAQNAMIEMGERTVPRFADLNGDGLQDLVVSNGSYKLKDTANVHTYYYYTNTGTATQPAFTLTDTNFMNIGSYGLGVGSIPTFADLDNDGDLDAIIGDRTGKLHYFKNSSASIPNFTLATAGIGNIDVGNNAAPFLYDIDSNGTYDLLIGNELGTINYYSNSSISTPTFTFEDNRLGGITTKGENTYGYSIPYMFKENGLDNLMVGSFSSGIFQFDSLAQVMSKPSLLQPTIGTGTIVSSGSDETPLGTKRRNGRNQFLFKSSELRQAGLVFGYINGISFKVTTPSNNIVENLHVRIKNTSDTVLSGFQTGLTEVLEIREGFSLGWNILQFTSPFLWDGASSIVIEVCFRGQPTSQDIKVEMTDVGFNANAYGDYVDPTLSGNGCAQPYLNTISKRPNIQLMLTPAFSNTENYASGIYTAPALADLNDDGFMDMVMGNITGGLTFYEGKIYDVGIKEVKPTGIANLNVFPNPGNGNFTISTPNMSKAKIGVYTLGGKLLLTKNVDSEETTVDLQNQPPGMYLFTLQSSEELRTAKVVKQ